jgi:hypothetical protein
MDITTHDLNSLAAKLDGLDLTAAERSLLDRIIDQSEGDGEVAGYADLSMKFVGDLSPTAQRLAYLHGCLACPHPTGGPG